MEPASDLAAPTALSSGAAQSAANANGGAGGGSSGGGGGSKKRSARANEYVPMPRAQQPHPPNEPTAPQSQSLVNTALISKCTVPRSITMTGISAYATNGLPPPQVALLENDTDEPQSRTTSTSTRSHADKPDSRPMRSKLVSFFLPRSRTRPDITSRSNSASAASNGSAHPERLSSLANRPSNTQQPAAQSSERHRQHTTPQKKASSKSLMSPMRLTDFTESVQRSATLAERQQSPERAIAPQPLEREPSLVSTTHATYAQYAPPARGMRGTTSLYFAGAVPGAEGDSEQAAGVVGMNRSESFFPPAATEAYQMRDTHQYLPQYANLPCVQELPQQSEDEHTSGGSLPWKPRAKAAPDVPTAAPVAQPGGGSTYTLMHNNELVQVRLRQPLPPASASRALTDQPQPPIPVCLRSRMLRLVRTALVYFEGVARCAVRVCGRRCLVCVCASPSLIDSQCHAAASDYRFSSVKQPAAGWPLGSDAGLSFNYSSRQLPNPCAITNHMSARLTGATDSQCSQRSRHTPHATRGATRAVLLTMYGVLLGGGAVGAQRGLVACFLHANFLAQKQSLCAQLPRVIPLRPILATSNPIFLIASNTHTHTHTHTLDSNARRRRAPHENEYAYVRLRRRHCCADEAR